MDWASKDLVGLVYHLLPGFLAAWVFYSLSSHPKETPFERVVGALIFTVIAQTLTSFVGRILVSVGSLSIHHRRLAIGTWAEDSSLAWSLVISFFVGLVFARFSNNDKFHKLLRRYGWTKRTSFPSEWFSVFNRERRWVILHMEGERRLYGWPEEWPDQPTSGHFILNRAEWLLDDGQRAPVSGRENRGRGHRCGNGRILEVQ